MKKNNLRTRKNIEIYFILYLAALVLLIPDKNELIDSIAESPNNSYLSLPFELKPEKNIMQAVFISDSLGISLVRMDSVNYIYYTGDIEDIDFTFTVEELTSNRRVILDDNNANTRLFTISSNRENNFAKFTWTPEISSGGNTSYNVTVTAEAVLSNGSVVTNSVNFSINVILESAQMALGDTDTITDNQNALIEQLRFDRYVRGGNLSNVILSPHKNNVYGHPNEKWENTIDVLGMNVRSDLQKNPKITIKQIPEGNGSSAAIVNYTRDGITMSGDVPSYGTLEVEVEMIRQIDGLKASTSFKVEPFSYGQPVYPEEMYPEMVYSFYPNIPFSAGAEIESKLQFDNGELIASSRGDTITYEPAPTDVGRTVIFKNSVNGMQIGSHSISIKPYASPEIVRIQLLNQQMAQVTTYSKGIFNGDINDVTSLEISGNAVLDGEIYGNFSTDRRTQSHTNIFRIRRKDNKRAFEFSVRAINKAGKSSKIKNYPD